MISTKNLSALPKGNKLKQICQLIAMLDAILEPNWEYRYYSFNSKWSNDEEMASMRDGSGDSYFILFKPQGTIIKGFSMKSPMGMYAVSHGSPWKGVIDEVPNEFKDFLDEPAFSIEETSFCIWNKSSEKKWKIGEINFPNGEDPDGSEGLLFILDGNHKTYLEWAENYYDRQINEEGIKYIFKHEPLTNELVEKLNPELRLVDLEDDAKEIDYPFK